MRRRLVFGALAIVGSHLTAAPAHATVGGPDLARPLGWDSRTRTVYWAIEHWDETGEPTTVVRFDLRRAGAQLPAKVGALTRPPGLEGLADGVTGVRWIREDSLVADLKPLIPVAISAADPPQRVMAQDTLKTRDYQVTRARVAVGPEGAPVQLTTFGFSHEVRLMSEWAIPGESRHIIVLSYIGDPFEDGHEIQMPILGPWSRTFVVPEGPLPR